MPKSKKPLYRISFVNHEEMFQVYTHNVGESDMFGFLEIEKLVFGETSDILVDPSEERLKAEFNAVKRTYIPMHSIIRIDEVEKEGTAKITELPPVGKANVSNFPTKPQHYT